MKKKGRLKSMTTVYIIIAIIALLVIFVIAIHNNLVTLRMRVKNAWAQIDTQLKRRFDLIPNLVETVKGYMVHEESTLENIVTARNKYTTASTFDDKTQANQALTSTLKSIFALAEAYPELKANENFKSLQNELSETEDKIAYSRQFYNDTVEIYNTAIFKFPSNLVANIFGFKEETFFEITDSKERENTKVNFNK